MDHYALHGELERLDWMRTGGHTGGTRCRLWWTGPGWSGLGHDSSSRGLVPYLIMQFSLFSVGLDGDFIVAKAKELQNAYYVDNYS